MSKQYSKGGISSTTAMTNLLAGGGAGIMEATICHPLDTVKVRMQLSHKQAPSSAPRGRFLQTFSRILRNEGFPALYKGFDAVFTGMGPKMAVRFTSFEAFKSLLASPSGEISGTSVFLAGLGAGVTEAVSVVSPMEVVKIRLQGQRSVLATEGTVATAAPAYRNAFHAVRTVAGNEGVGALYQGGALTALRQGTNQAVNFTVYTMVKDVALKLHPQRKELPSYQTGVIGLFSGAMGPLCNAPIDTIKTRMQQSTRSKDQSGLQKVVSIAASTLKNEGVRAFYKGLTPRIVRVAPGQAVSFTVYEFLKKKIQDLRV